ncbi:MAG: outer membrane beta-barrel protein [Ignavibacteriaceae bacterium]|nr:outer membrane beta-barrel protein [Ignavibacteriaceae bacterium]
MKIRKCFFVIMSIIILTPVSHAQGLKLGVGGGTSTISNSNSGLSYNAGYHVSVKAKFDIPLIPLKPVAYMQYYFLNGSYSFANFTRSTTQNIFALGFGAEYSLIPGPISPYLAVDFGYNNIGEVKYDPKILNAASYPSISRTGLDIGAGLEISIPFLFSFDINAKYNMLNLFGKQGGEGSINAVNLNLSIIM